MAKERNPARRKTVNETVHALGVRGRKTGIELPDTGIRDEHGMEPLDHLFSSPERPSAPAPDLGNETIDEEMDMEIESPDAGPAPSDFLKKNDPKTRLPPPRARSPPRTSFNSPPIRHPGLMSSSRRSSVVNQQSSSSPPFQSAAVKRKLTFSARTKLAPPVNGYHAAADGNGTLAEEAEEDEEDEEDSVLRANGTSVLVDESVAMAGDDPDPVEDDPELGEEEDDGEVSLPKEPTPKGKAKRGRPGRNQPPSLDPSPDEPKRRGRPKGKRSAEEALEKPSKKRRSLSNSQGEGEEGLETETALEPDPRPKVVAKRGNAAAAAPKAMSKGKRSSAHKPATESSKGKGPKSRGRPKASDVADESVVVRQEPPMPKKAGLAIVRHVDEEDLKTTRSGRHSYKPVEYWRGESIKTDQETIYDPNTKRRMVVPSVSEIVRVKRPSPPRKASQKRKQGRPSHRRREISYDDEEDLPRDPWETETGRIAADVVVWEREHERNPPAADDPISVSEQEVAISSSATMTREIKDATFRFTKTLTTPYFGTGVVDLPPGSEKRPKNSRKMHMAFFVHTGVVRVTVNETEFSIGAGGQWFVPRGNYYSIRNDTDREARIFFAQACEINE